MRAQFFGFGTAPKPTWTQVHQTHFGFNADGSPKMALVAVLRPGVHATAYPSVLSADHLTCSRRPRPHPSSGHVSSATRTVSSWAPLLEAGAGAMAGDIIGLPSALKPKMLWCTWLHVGLGAVPKPKNCGATGLLSTYVH